MKPILVHGMFGLGDNLHQRAIIRQLVGMGREVWLETTWPSIYHDLGDKLHFVRKPSLLRTQEKNADREAYAFETAVPAARDELKIWYTPQLVRQTGSVLAAMAAYCQIQIADFRMSIPGSWKKGIEWFAECSTKPIMVYRPLVERTEWGGCKTRNPDPRAYRQLFEAIRDRFYVVSVADLEPGKEWLSGEEVDADAEFHRGQLTFEKLAALFAGAGLVFTSSGFAAILGQAVTTPTIAVMGGYESSRSFSAGARYSPFLGIDPITPCECYSHHHDCDKRIDITVATAAIKGFINEHC